jgi:hypothetical protein
MARPCIDVYCVQTAVSLSTGHKDQKKKAFNHGFTEVTKTARKAIVA